MLCPKLSLESLTYNNIRLEKKCNVIVHYNVPGDKQSKIPDFSIGKSGIHSKWVSLI